jgi:glycerol-1-phosphate dehydrogenase [NAD(P)+]
LKNLLSEVEQTFSDSTSDLEDSLLLVEKIKIDHDALSEVPTFIQSKRYDNVMLVVDNNTYRAAGERVVSLLSEADIKTNICNVKGNELGEVVADEQAIIQVLLETPMNTDAIIAVGSGTIHDIVRFASFQRTIPFISVPTAASVDGFTSAGAPIITRGFKQTVQCAAPIAVFADLGVLTAAPKELTAAGFGDILGKYTSLADWKVSNWVGEEPYHSSAAELTRRTLEMCITNVEEIAESTSDGIKLLMEALIQSGLVMMMLGHSRPASGAEHHLSHFWEMDGLRKGKRQLLHGAKVGVATTIITENYQTFARMNLEPSKITLNESKKERLLSHWEEIQNEYRNLPNPEELAQLLEKVGGPTSIIELGISQELKNEALTHAHTLRDRWTGLRIMNTLML